MPATQAFYLASQFKIFFDILIIQNAEAVDDGSGSVDPFYDVIRIQIEVILVTHGQDHGIDTSAVAIS